MIPGDAGDRIIDADLQRPLPTSTTLPLDAGSATVPMAASRCAVQEAIREGFLPAERLESYKKLKKEARYEGLNSKMIEREKITEMFSGFGGMKNARKFIKEKARKKQW